MQRGLREIRRSNLLLANHQLDPARTSGGFGFYPRLAVPNQDQQTPLGPGVLHRDSHELLDETGEDHLTRKCLRSFNHSRDVELYRWRNRGRGGGSPFVAKVRVEFVELLYFSVGSPTRIERPSLLQIRLCDLLQSPSSIETRCQFVGERFVVNKTIRLCGVDGIFVKFFGVERAAFDARNFRSHQSGAVFEILRAVFRPYLELFVVSFESIVMLPALARRCRITERCTGKRAVKFTLCRRKIR